jgi:hypothetical protein
MEMIRKLLTRHSDGQAAIIDIIVRVIGCLLLTISFIGTPIHGQVSTANMTGTVEDSTGAAIPNAHLRLINTQTGTENDSITNNAGGFVLPGVIPGVYTLRIRSDGFATTQVDGITLNIGDSKNILIRMRIGPVSESVEVDASGLTLNDSNASVSTVVDRKFVGNLPLDGRSFQDLISMTPGVVTRSPQTAGQPASSQGDFSVNGQQPESNSFFVDGVSANINSGLTSGESRLTSTGTAAGATALGTTQTLVSIDALQEFRVLSSTYSAEYGRTPGGQFTFLSRSGTESLHGTAYEYFRNNHFDAADWFTSSLNPSLESYSQNDFGGTAGGPVTLSGIARHQQKTFFFLSYEGLYLAQPTPQTYRYTLSSEVHDQAPPALAPLLDTFPSPFTNGELLDSEGNPSGLTSFYLFSYSRRSHVNSTSLRVDQTFSPKFSAFFRYGDTPSYGQTGQLWSGTANQVDTRTYTFGADAHLSSIKDNEFRLGYAGSSSVLDTTTDPVDATISESLDPALGIPSSYTSARGDAYIHIAGVGDTESDTDLANDSLRQWNIRDTFSLQSGKHLFKLGIDERHVASTSIPAAVSVEADFFSRQSIVDDLASHIVLTKNEPASPRINEFSAFAQDEWRVSKTLTLSLGLRWEVNPPPTGTRGSDAYTVRGSVSSPSTLRLEPRGTPLWHTSWLNLAPRFGTAWTLHSKPGKEMVARAGAGIFFDTGNGPALGAFTGAGFSTTSIVNNAPIPIMPTQLEFFTAPAVAFTGANVFAFPAHFQLPYSLQWNVGLEQELGKDQSITISYVGANGRRLMQEQRRDINTVNPAFGDVTYFPSGLTCSYHALQVKLQRSISRGAQALVSYTWAHSLDYGSTDPAYPLERSNADLDVRHNLEAAVSWDIPKPDANRLTRSILGGWGVDGRLMARTSFPVTLLGNLLSDSVTGQRYFSSVDLIPDRPLYLREPQYPGSRIFNGGSNVPNPAFSLPNGTDYGDAPRNLLRGFDAVQVNAALRRDIHLYSDLNLQFRVETYNILNHPNFGYIDPSLTDQLFGQATKMLNQSFGSTGALYQQGGPRSVQFALKLTF